jgi:hypothetical protein
MSSKPDKQEEHSEVIRKDTRNTRPGTGNSRATHPGVGPSETVVDKSLRPSLFRWRSWQVSESFRNYAERAARGEKLARFEGSILANPHQHSPPPPPTQRYNHRSPPVRPPAWLLDPKSLIWNTWVWGSLGLAFAIGLFAFTVWVTAPKDELDWASQAAPPAAPATPSVAVRAARPAKKPPAEPPVAVTAPVVSEPAPVPAAAQASPTAPAPIPAAAPAPARPPVVAVATAPAKAPEAKPAPPAPSNVQEIRDALNRLEGTVANANGSRTVSPSAATNKPMEAPAPTAPAATASASATASTPAAPPAPKRDPLLVEAPSF